MKKNNFLNTLKGLACIFVVFMHICFPTSFGRLVINIGGFAVPIFFMISGYFSYKESLDKMKSALTKKIKRIAGNNPWQAVAQRLSSIRIFGFQKNSFL